MRSWRRGGRRVETGVRVHLQEVVWLVFEDDEVVLLRDGVDVAENAQDADDGVDGVCVRACELFVPVVIVAHPVCFERAADQHVAESESDEVGCVESEGEVDGEFPASGQCAGDEASVE